MTKKILFLCAMSVLCALSTLEAQSDSSKTSKPEFKLSVIYNTNLNYYGRTDSLKSSGLFPVGEFWISPKFYVSAAPVFVSNAVQSFDYVGTVSTIGFQHTTKSWMTNISVVKPLYEKSSQLMQSALKVQANANVTHLGKVLNVTLGTDVKFSDKTDYGATAGLDHSFPINIGKGGMLVIDPSVYAFAGTRQFSRVYSKQQTGLLPNSADQITNNSYQSFDILAYETSVPVIYFKGKIMLIATPSYVMPQNLMKDPVNPELSEEGENTFYTTLAIKYSF